MILSEKECLCFIDKLKRYQATSKEFSYEEYKIIQKLQESKNKQQAIQDLFKGSNKDIALYGDVLQYYLVTEKETPIEQIVEIVDTPSSPEVLLKILDRDDVSKSAHKNKIYKTIMDNLFTETIKEYLCRKENAETEDVFIGDYPQNENISQDALKFLSQYNEDFNYFPIWLIKDEPFIEKIMEICPDDEKLHTAIVNNVFLSDDIRNRAFDEGCIIEEIINPTIYIKQSVYESAIDTLSMEENKNTKSFQNAIKLMKNFSERNLLTEAQQIDAVLRYANEKKVGYCFLYDYIIKNTQYNLVFDKIIDVIGDGDSNHPALDKMYFGLNIPNRLLDKKAQYKIESIKGASTIGIETEKLIYKALSQECLSNKESYQILLDLNHFGFNSAIAKDANTPNEILRKLIRSCRNTSQQSTAIIAALNIAMNKESIGNRKHKSLMFNDVMKSILNTSYKKLNEIINGGEIDNNMPIYVHNLKENNENCLLSYFEDAKLELKDEKELYDLMDKIILHYKKSFEKDKIYNQLNLTVKEYNGENGDLKFDETIKYVSLNTETALKNTFQKLKFSELISFEHNLFTNIPRINLGDASSKNTNNLYIKLNDYIATNSILEKSIKEKEKTISKDITR